MTAEADGVFVVLLGRDVGPCVLMIDQRPDGIGKGMDLRLRGDRPWWSVRPGFGPYGEFGLCAGSTGTTSRPASRCKLALWNISMAACATNFG